jgi:hypothetical protein
MVDVNLFLSSTDKNEFINICFLFFQVDLPNLKCFSLTSYRRTQEYEIHVLPLLRRLTYLEELTLYLWWIPIYLWYSS